MKQPFGQAGSAETSSSSGSVSRGLTLRGILWDVSVRQPRGGKVNRTFRYGPTGDSESGLHECSLRTKNESLLKAILDTERPVVDGHQYNSFVAFRKQNDIVFPKEGYAGVYVSFAQTPAEASVVRVTEDGVSKRLKSGDLLHVSGSRPLKVECGEEVVGAVFFSIRSETLAPRLRELGFPLRTDSYAATQKGVSVAGKLTDADLTTHGYVRKILTQLTVECGEFGALARTKQLEEVYPTKEQLRKAVMAAGWTGAQTNHAMNVSDRYELHEGLFYRLEFDAKLHTMTYAWCVPKGSVRSQTIFGGTHTVSVRNEVIAWFHESRAFGFHSTLDATYSKLVTRYCWPGMFENVEKYVRDCLECKELRGRPLVSATVRSDLYDGPFVCVFFDHVGPVRPSSANGCRYLLTCCCAFSGWGWACPVPETTAVTTGGTLYEKVFCGLAGFPIFVRHDRSTSSLNDVIKGVHNIAGIIALVGSAWRPQAQGPLETTHRKLGLPMRTLCGAFLDDWERRILLAVWAWRVTPMPTLGGRSPYRVVLGLEPRSPFTFAPAPQCRKLVDVNEYVKGMIEVHDSTVKFVKDFKERARDAKEDKQARKSKTGELEVGDFVLVLKPEFIGATHRLGPISKKLMHRVYNEVFQVHHKLSQSAYILKDAATGADPTTLQNLVNIGRMMQAMVWQVKEPVGSTLKRLELLQDDEVTLGTGMVVRFAWSTMVRTGKSGWTLCASRIAGWCNLRSLKAVTGMCTTRWVPTGLAVAPVFASSLNILAKVHLTVSLAYRFRVLWITMLIHGSPR